MAVAYDAQSESHTGTTGSASEASFSWTHTPSGTPKGVLVYVFTNANADYITGVTYGGVTMTQVDEAADTAGEPGRCTAFFLGEGIPTGAQTVAVTRTNNATVMYAVAFTVTAGAGMNTATTGVVKQTTDGTLAEQSVNDGSPGTNSLRFGGINSGLGSVPAAGANSTAGPGIDFGTRVVGTVRETTAGQGSRSVGFSSGTSDDRAAVYLAVYEVAAPTGIGVVSEASNSGNSTSIVANKPAGLDDGHVWLVVIALPDQNGVVIDTPTGWTHEGSVDSLTPGGQHLSFWTKEITDAAGEPSTVTFTKSTSGTAGDDQFETWSGAIGHLDGTDPVEAYGWLGLEDTSGSTHTTDSLTTLNNGDYVVSGFVQDQSTSDGAWAPSSPGGLVELHEVWTPTGNCGFAVYGEQRTTAGAGAHSATQTTGGDNTRGSATGIIAFAFVGGSVVTLEAAISTTPTISIEAAITRAVAASLSVVPTLSAQLAVTRAVTAALSPTPTVSGQIVATRGLAASLAPTPTVTAEFNYVRTLAAVIAGSSTVSGDVSVQRAIAAAISGSGAVTADLVNQILLAASLSGTSTLSASLARLYVTLSASLAGSSTVDSDLSLVKLLEAAITTNPTLSAELVRSTVGLSADLTGQGTINANLNFAVLSLAAALAGTSTVTVEDFDRAVGFAAAISTTPTTSADLVAVRSLAASLAGGSSIDADTTVIISSFEALDASLTGGSVVTADMVRAYVQLSAAIACSASVSAEMSGGQEPYRELGMHGQMTARITALLEPFMAPERRKHGNS